MKIKQLIILLFSCFMLITCKEPDTTTPTNTNQAPQEQLPPITQQVLALLAARLMARFG